MCALPAFPKEICGHNDWQYSSNDCTENWWMKIVPMHPKMVFRLTSLNFLQMWCATEERTYSMADLHSWVRVMCAHESIQVDWIVSPCQLSICPSMVDAEGLRQKNQNNSCRSGTAGPSLTPPWDWVYQEHRLNWLSSNGVYTIMIKWTDGILKSTGKGTWVHCKNGCEWSLGNSPHNFNGCTLFQCLILVV